MASPQRGRTNAQGSAPPYPDATSQDRFRDHSPAPSYRTIESRRPARSSSPAPSYSTTDARSRHGTSAATSGPNESTECTRQSGPTLFKRLFAKQKRGPQNVPHSRPETELEKAVERGNVPSLTILLYGRGAGQLKGRGHNELCIAVHKNRPDIVSLLIQHGADPDDPGEDCATIRQSALHLPDTSVLEVLLRSGVRLDTQDADRRSILHYWIQRRADGYIVNSASLGLLLQGGTDTNACDIHGNTPLHQAMLSSPPDTSEVVGMLQSYGALVNARNGQGHTPLYLATGMGDEAYAVVLLLITYGAEVNVQSKDGSTELTNAAMLGRWDLVRLLQKVKKANFNTATLAALKRLEQRTAVRGTAAQLAALDAVYKLAKNLDDPPETFVH